MKLLCWKILCACISLSLLTGNLNFNYRNKVKIFNEKPQWKWIACENQFYSFWDFLFLANVKLFHAFSVCCHMIQTHANIGTSKYDWNQIYLQSCCQWLEVRARYNDRGDDDNNTSTTNNNNSTNNNNADNDDDDDNVEWKKCVVRKGRMSERVWKKKRKKCRTSGINNARSG